MRLFAPDRLQGAPLLAAYVTGGLVATSAWTRLDALGGWLIVLLALSVALDRSAAAWRVGPSAPMVPASGRPRRPTRGSLAIGFAISAPVLLHVALTVREEFGYGGDEGYHLSVARAFARHLLWAVPLLAVALPLSFAVASRARYTFAVTITLAALTVASLWVAPNPVFARYPTAFYWIAVPLNVAFDVVGFPYPFVANHVMNALSVPVWLFVLRPWLLDRWPDRAVLPAALFVYLQPMALVYVGGGMLEPWAAVFVLLAVEGILVLPEDRLWITMLLAGAAAWFKETAILFLPAVWSLSQVEWNGLVPTKLRRGAWPVSLAAVIPLAAYFLVRRQVNVQRGYSLADAAALWAPGRAAEWLGHVQHQLGAGMFVALLVAGWAGIGCWQLRRDPSRWRPHVAWTVTAVALVCFFYVDAASVPYTGYGRFLAYPMLALAGVVLTWTHHEAGTQGRRIAALTILVACLQAFPTVRMLALDAGPDPGRNSLEWTHALVRFPIRALAERLPGLTEGHAVTEVRVIAFTADLISTRVAYPDLSRRYHLVLDQQRPAAPDCRCRDAAEAILATFELAANFTRDQASVDALALGPAACIEQARTTCATTSAESYLDGRPVGVLGVGVR